ncbi:MAG TPA: hypothetical protein VGU27_10475 [Candidatus Eisenbacteria bacterium]|nr:hypothetical protein [Candidatus Eisenbacteria bacterium]
MMLQTSFGAGPLMTRVQAMLTGAGDTLAATGLAIVVVAVGALLARLLGWAVTALLGALRFDAAIRSLARAESLRPSPTALLGWAVRWTILLFSILLAGDLLGFELTSAVSARLGDLLPRVTVAAIVLVAGLLLSLAFAWTARRLFQTAGIAGEAPSRVVAGVLGTFSVLIAVEQLGLAAQVVTWIAVTIVGSVGLAFALAFGLGCRELARDFLVELLRSLHDDAPPRPR